MSMRSSSKRQKTSVKDGRLLERIKEEKLANSIPKAEFDTVKLSLQLEIDDLQRRLSDSVPRADLEYVKSELQRICDVQGRYSTQGEETQELRVRISELEKLLRSTPGPDTERDGRVSIEDYEESEITDSEEPESTESTRL